MTDVFKVMVKSSDVKEPVVEDHKVKAQYNPFDFINSINSHKDLFAGSETPETVEKEYTPWVVNKGLSYFADTVESANFVNRYHQLDKKVQYDYLINTIRSKKRMSKWWKKEDNNDVEMVKEAFGYSQKKAEVALSLLSPENLKDIKRRLNKGGLKK